jgi:DNA-binding NarL/FixJ family response regulator
MNQQYVGERPEASELNPVMVGFIDERRFVRELLTDTLRRHAPDIDVHAFANVEEIELPYLALAIFWIDQVGPGALRLLEQQVSALRARFPTTPIAGLVGSVDPEVIRRAIETGMTLVLLNSASHAVAIASLRLALAGGASAPTELLATSMGLQELPQDLPEPENAGGAPGFTMREQQIMQCVIRGLQNKAIAYELGICENTVKVHMRSLLRKLQATNRTQMTFRFRMLVEGADRSARKRSEFLSKGAAN